MREVCPQRVVGQLAIIYSEVVTDRVFLRYLLSRIQGVFSFLLWAYLPNFLVGFDF